MPLKVDQIVVTEQQFFQFSSRVLNKITQITEIILLKYGFGFEVSVQICTKTYDAYELFSQPWLTIWWICPYPICFTLITVFFFFFVRNTAHTNGIVLNVFLPAFNMYPNIYTIHRLNGLQGITQCIANLYMNEQRLLAACLLDSFIVLYLYPDSLTIDTCGYKATKPATKYVCNQRH